MLLEKGKVIPGNMGRRLSPCEIEDLQVDERPYVVAAADVVGVEEQDAHVAQHADDSCTRVTPRSCMPCVFVWVGGVGEGRTHAQEAKAAEVEVSALQDAVSIGELVVEFCGVDNVFFRDGRASWHCCCVCYAWGMDAD